jgi:zinc D-Ala-D-Ala carboxypeptidase|tara:strand:- start:1500 stop:1970 length:471 start_codon:yes stop_codon:yes gene_type:complete
MTTKLTDHFTLQEMCRSDTATRLGIDNIPTDDVIIANLRAVCVHVLEPVRTHFDTPFSPNSGYRCSALNKAIGSSSKSQHTKGQAADIEVPGVDNSVLAEWIKENCTFDQLILEFYKSGEPASGWVHASFILPDYGVNRAQCITFDGNAYMQGLQP